MDRICCSCIEWKSIDSCSNISKLPVEQIFKYCTETDLTKNLDGEFYVCTTCKSSISSNREPRRCQKEIFGLLNFPDKLMEDLEEYCVPWDEKQKEDPDKKYLQLNRLEDYLLKPIIPFIRIGHMPRGRYFQLKGDLIMVTANVVDSLQKILPVEQNLVPVALKRKIEYSGFYMQEYVDRSKVKQYFQWFQKHNHIYQDMTLNENLINEFEEEAKRIAEHEDRQKNDIITNHDEILQKKVETYEVYNSDEEEDEEKTATLDKEHVSCDNSSFITDKYMEDISSNTVANKFSDMIISFEQLPEEVEIFNPDPEQAFHVEDEIYMSDDELEEEEECLEEYDFSYEEISKLNQLKNMKTETRQIVYMLKTNADKLCKCEVERKISFILKCKFEIEKISVVNARLVSFKDLLLKNFSDCIENSRMVFRSTPKNCHHEYNSLNNDLENYIKNNEANEEKTSAFVKKQTIKIKENAEKISVAPSEAGKWVNWYSDLFLEEKLFPKLFPYGIGGYLSSNMLKKSNIGFSNYIKNRLLSADPKFRNDASYMFFLLLVKELTDIKRSEQTYLRKASKSSNLTAKKVGEIGKEHLMRYDNAFTTYKTIRGTSMYYQDSKKKLMATLRQQGAPTLFCTFSCAEFDWNSLAQSIFQTINKSKISMEEIKQMSAAKKNKLVSENVTQSTIHFAKRTDKLMSLLNDGGIFLHDEKDYKVDSYFYRVEFQARGAPHIHCVFWLKDKDGNKPPSMWNEENKSDADLGGQIASFCDSIMSGSSTSMNCEIHAVFDYSCKDCIDGKNLVEKYQSHKHTFSCRKKGKKIRILAAEGHGRLDKKKVGEEILASVCRLRHPKYPIDKTEFVHGFSQDVDENVLKEAKKDYQKVRKYLLRLTHAETFKESEEWKKFKKMTFEDFLFEVGMFRDERTRDDPIEIEQARKRYLTALRCEVKSSGMVVLKRNTSDIFTNNFNKMLIKLHQANQDIQYISDEYAVAEYITNYLTKNESGLSSLLKNINDEALKEGENVLVTIKKLGKALDKGREMSVQEAIYRALGLTMAKFRDVVRFINTNHPERREGLLRSNLEELDDDEKIFHNSLHDYYQIRPTDEDDDDIVNNDEEKEKGWEDQCLADFVAKFNIAYRKEKNVIKLQDDKSYISKRIRPAVLRYYLKYDNEEEYFRALCILFLPFRNEMKDIHSKDVTKLYKDNKDLIEENRQVYEKHRTMIDLIEEVGKDREEECDDMEEIDSPYIDEETTAEEEIKDFEKKLKAEAQKMMTNYNAGSSLMEENDYLEMISKLNEQQRNIFDDFVERINCDQEGNSFYLYIGGNAGTGKSFLLKAMINAAKKRGKRSGAELDKPISLTIAPTGVAAYLVNGTTIESALGIQPTKDRAYVRNQPSRNSNLRFLYEDLKVIFIDEISMVGSDMLAKINFRLQDIMGNTEFMGGVSIVCTGDFGQLPPVGQQMAWSTSFLDNRIDISPKHWEAFKIYFLTEKMRSQDEEFSIICDEVRKGVCDEKVTEYLKKHVGTCSSENDNEKYASGKFSIIVTNNKAREAINNEKLEKLLPHKKTYYSNAIDKSTNNPNAPVISPKLPLTRTGQLQTKILFKEDAPVMITSNHPKSKYKNNGLVNGARGFIDSIQASVTDPDVAQVVWVRFTDDKIGQLLRIDSCALLQHHTPRDPLSVPITKQKKPFQGRGNTAYLRDQFPLTLCYAVTAHKSQGQTLEEVLIDYSDEGRINNGSFYTAMSRVKFGKNLYLKDFKTEYVKANPEVEKKMEAMKLFNKHLFKKTYNTESIFISDEEEIKVGYININDIYESKSTTFINKDSNLLAIDFLVLADTRLSEEISNDVLLQELTNWSIEARYDSEDNKKHMGLLMLKSNSSKVGNLIETVEEKKYLKNDTTQMQVLFVSFKDYCMKTAFIYTRESPTQEQVKMLKKDLLNIDLVMGDLNLDPNRKLDSGKLETLLSGRSSVLNEITTTRFNQIDHIHLNCKKFSIYFATSFINYTTDHHLLSSRIAKNENRFNPAFLQKLSCYRDNNDKRRKTEGIKRNFDAKHEREFSKEESKRNPKKDTASQAEVDLTCLFSPNWLDDLVINAYLKLLNAQFSHSYMYSTYFHQAFTEGGFERVENYYRRDDVLSFSTIFIPVHHGSHWFLITFNGKELISFDPYNYPGANGIKKEKLLEENKQFHRSILTKLKYNYFEPLYKKYNRICESIEITVKLPPEIPAQENNHDCGVFLLSFTKYLVLKTPFNFGTADMIFIRETIRKELQSAKVVDNSSQMRHNKRKGSQSKDQVPRKKKNDDGNERWKQRRIINPDAETCWLNSCLQLVLTALDFKDVICPTGSVLWQNLLWLQGKDSSVVLDPTDVKQTILYTERERVVRRGVAPSHTLFDLGNSRRELRMDRIGQQDCKDFFFCLDENRESWTDVFNLFKIKTLSETECSSCGHSSRQKVSGNERTFITLTCPNEEVDMKDYLEDQMNSFNVVEDWRDEDGCGNQAEGRLRTRISNIEDTNYVIFVLERLTRIDERLRIMRTKVNVNQNELVHLMDIEGKFGIFEPIAIIHHSGYVVGQTTQGHYRADVKNNTTRDWFRTSDNDPPENLSAKGLTEMGYIFLYRRVAVEIDAILKSLDEMNRDLVFYEFDELMSSEANWILRVENYSSQEILRCIDKIGKKMINYSLRVNLEVIFLLTVS